MSYQRTTAPQEALWHTAGQHAPSPYQRTNHNDFNHSTAFNLEDYVFLNEAPVSQSSGYEPPYPSVTDPPGCRRQEPGPGFNQEPNWRQHNQQVGPLVHNNPRGSTFNQPPPHVWPGPHPTRNPQQGGAPIRGHPQPPPADPAPRMHPLQVRRPDATPPGVAEFTCTNMEPNATAETEPRPVSHSDPSHKPQQDTSKDSEKTSNDVIIHPVVKVPVKRKANGTHELGNEEGKKKAKKAGTPSPTPQPKKLPEKIWDGCYCELCDLVCSGPLNLRMHMNGAKHKVNESQAEKGEKTSLQRQVQKKGRDQFLKEGPIPATHNQEETPLIGLDYITRVIFPDKGESEDLFECSLCAEKDLTNDCIYQHLMCGSHRKAYIRKLKPDLADQYSNIANVYDKNGQLQRRQNSDLSALLNNLSKIVARRDGPGEMQIRLSNERETDGEDVDDFGVEGYDSEPDDSNCPPLGTDKLHHHGKKPGRLPAEPPGYPAIPRPPYSPADPPEQMPQSDNTALPHSHLQPDGQGTSQRLHHHGSSPNGPPVAHLPSRSLSTEKAPPNAPPHAPPTPLNPYGPPVMRLLPCSVSLPPKANAHAEDTPPSLTRPPPKETAPISNRTISSAYLPSLTDEQLRFYCSDVFIAQEYRRRFGDPEASTAQPENKTREINNAAGVANSTGITVETLLKSMSSSMVNNEQEANMAMQITRTLTQATLKYRLHEKDFALQKKDGKR